MLPPLHAENPSDSIASLDLSVFENETKITSEYLSNELLLVPLGNTFTVSEDSGKKVLHASQNDGSPYADIYVTGNTLSGTSLIMSVSLKLASDWCGSASVISPFYTDNSGILQVFDILRISETGSVFHVSDSETSLASVAFDKFTEIKVIFSSERTSYEIEIDGDVVMTDIPVPQKLKAPEGIRLFRINDSTAASGGLYVTDAYIKNGPTYFSYETNFSESFSGETENVAFSGDNCFINANLDVLKIINDEATGVIPYFELSAIERKINHVISFPLKISDIADTLTLASVYGNGARLGKTAYISNGTLYLSNGSPVMQIKENQSYRITLWLNPKSCDVALFIDGICVSESISYTPVDEKTELSLRFCLLAGEGDVTIDDFSHKTTRASISDLPPLTVTLSADESYVLIPEREQGNYCNVYVADEKNGEYSEIASQIRTGTFVLPTEITEKHYKFTYAFDFLGEELFAPFSEALTVFATPVSTPSKTPNAPQKAEFSQAAVWITVISVIAFTAFVIPLIPTKEPLSDKTRKDKL